MAKKRKLSAVSQRPGEVEEHEEVPHGTEQPEEPEPAGEDGVHFGEENTHVPSAAVEDVQVPDSLVPDEETVVVGGAGSEDQPMEEVPFAGSAVVDSAFLAPMDRTGDAVIEAVGSESSIFPEAVSSAVNGDGIGDRDGDGVPAAIASAVEGEGNAGLDASVGAAVEDEDEPESIQKLLEPLSKDQLINLLSFAAEKYSDVMEQVNQVVDEDPVHRKIFVHGLGWETTVDNLASFFRQYGEIEDSNIVCDKVSGKSKGYGFILFKHRAGARRALKSPQKKIGNRMTACQMASAGPAPAPAPPQSEFTQRKIYVSNVSADIDPQKVLQFFAKYGEIEEGPLGLDKQTGKPKGFALFVYKTVEGAKKALEEPHKNFDGHLLHCQKAIDGPKPSKLTLLPHHRGLHQGGAPSRSDPTSFGMGNIGHLMAPGNTGPPYKKPTVMATASGSGFSPGFGQNMAPLLAKPGQGLGLPMAPLPVSSGARGLQGAYGSQPAVMSGSMNPGVMGSYGAHIPMQGGYGNPALPHGTGRGKHAMGYRGGVGHYMP